MRREELSLQGEELCVQRYGKGEQRQKRPRLATSTSLGGP